MLKIQIRLFLINKYKIKKNNKNNNLNKTENLIC
jgi:hypothetical protein